MPSATTHGYPYPVGSDDLADTDLHIKALADFLNNARDEAYIELLATASTALSAATYTTIALANTNHANTTYFTVASSIVTIVQTGLYDISAMAEVGNATTDQKGVIIFRNGTSIRVAQQFTISNAMYASPCVLQYPLTAGDTIRLVGISTTAATASYVAGTDVARLMIRKVG